MPEGPEIKLAADQIAAVLEQQRVREVFFEQPRLAHYATELEGQKVLDVSPRGKALLISFDNNLTLYSHNQLYGVWHLCDYGQTIDTKRTLRVALHTKHHSALLFSASSIEVLDPAALADHPFLNRIGPDVLDPQLNWRDVAQRLLTPTFRRRSLASLYLDQGFLAGVGNYLRSEILFDAGLSPMLKPAQLSAGAIGALARSTLNISRRAYATAGVTNPARRARRLEREGADYEAYRFMVFGRDGLPCYGCSSNIVKIVMASRRLYYCSNCQVEPNDQ